MKQAARDDPRHDATLLSRKRDLDIATESALLAFKHFCLRMQSTQRSAVTDDDRLHVEKLADAVFEAEGQWAARALQLGMRTRSRNRLLVRTDLWNGVMFLQDSVWDAQLAKVAAEQELEEKKHLALAALHEVCALEKREKRTGIDLKESLLRARATANDRVLEVNECKLRLAGIQLRATPSVGGGFGMTAPPKLPQLDHKAQSEQTVEENVRFEPLVGPLDVQTVQSLTVSCLMLFH